MGLQGGGRRVPGHPERHDLIVLVPHQIDIGDVNMIRRPGDRTMDNESVDDKFATNITCTMVLTFSFYSLLSPFLIFELKKR